MNPALAGYPPAQAFPPRPVHARPPWLLRVTFVAYLGVLIFGGLLLLTAIGEAPALVTDWRIRDGAVRVPGTVQLRPDDCGTRIVLDLCDAILRVPGPNGPVRHELHYTFIAFQDRFTAFVVAHPDHPEWLSTDLGLDHFWNRVATLLVLWAAMGTCLVLIVSNRIRAWQQHWAWRARPMAPTVLEMVEATADQKASYWTVRAASGTQQRWTVPNSAKPFVLGPAYVILGLESADGRTVMPLDAKLRWVGLSTAERKAILAAQGG